MMDIKSLIQHQIEEMDRHKWIESEKAGFDLGQQAMLDWAENFMDKDFTQKPSTKAAKAKLAPAVTKIPQAK